MCQIHIVDSLNPDRLNHLLEFQDPKMEVPGTVPYKAIFWGEIPLHGPYMNLKEYIYIDIYLKTHIYIYMHIHIGLVYGIVAPIFIGSWVMAIEIMFFRHPPGLELPFL